LLVAVVLALITWRFWRSTRPIAAGPNDEGSAPSEPATVGARG
jgi:hypothetical protein